MKKAMRHDQCGNWKLETLVEFDATSLLGTPFPVVLHDAVQQKVCECGKPLGVVIPKSHELLEMVALLRVMSDMKLAGKEVRFLRKILGLKSKQLAEVIGLTPQHFSRVENGHLPISSAHERLLRLHVCIEFLETAVSAGLTSRLRSVSSLRINPVRSSEEEISFDLSYAPASEVLKVSEENRVWETSKEVA